MKAALSPLRLPGFARLASAYTINDVGNWIGAIALPLIVFDRTGSVMAATALFLALEFVPAFLTPALVARLEVTGTGTALPLLYAGGASIYLALAGLADSGAIALILTLAALDGTLTLSGRALTRAAAASVLKPAGKVRQGNAILNMCFTVGYAGGPALAGLVIAVSSTKTALLVNAVSFAIAGALLVGRSIPSVKAEPERWLARLRDGISYVRGRPTLRRLLGVQALAVIFFTAATPIEVVFVKETLGAGDVGYGLLLTAWGAGTIVGGVVFAATRRVSLIPLLGGSTLLIGAAFIGFAIAPNLALACIAAGIGGIGNGVQWVSIMSAVQTLASGEFQGRVISLLESVASLMPGIGFVLGGTLTAAVSARFGFAVAGVAIFAVVALAAPLLRGVSVSEDADHGRSDGSETPPAPLSADPGG